VHGALFGLTFRPSYYRLDEPFVLSTVVLLSLPLLVESSALVGRRKHFSSTTRVHTFQSLDSLEGVTRPFVQHLRTLGYGRLWVLAARAVSKTDERY
jgi:hypothetical protein